MQVSRLIFVPFLAMMFLFSCKKNPRKPKFQIKMQKHSWELTKYTVDGVEKSSFKEFIIDREDDIFVDISIDDSADYHNGHKRCIPVMDGTIMRLSYGELTPTSREEIKNQELVISLRQELPTIGVKIFRRVKVIEITNKVLILESGTSDYDNVVTQYDTQPGDYQVERFEFKAI